MEELLKSRNIDDDIINILKENDIDMEVLRSMTEQDLKDVGITSFGKRRKLYIIITTLNMSVMYHNEGSSQTSTPTISFPGKLMSSTHEQIAQASQWMMPSAYSLPVHAPRTPPSNPIPSISHIDEETIIKRRKPSECYALVPHVPRTSPSNPIPSMSHIDEEAIIKRMKPSECCALTFDLVGGMEHNVEGRKYLSVKDSGIPPTNKQRKVIVNIAVASLIEKRGMYPTAAEKILLAKEIIRVFPSTKDTTSGMEGFEHFYKTGAGFIEYRLKNLRLSYNTSRKPIKMKQSTGISPVRIEQTTEAMDPPIIKVEDQLKEKVNWMKCFPRTTDNEQRHRKLFRETFQHRRQLVEQGHTSTSIITEFPRFRDMPELINLEFDMFYKDTGDKFTSNWSSYFTNRVLNHGKRENQTITELIESYENGDSDLCALLVVFTLLHSNASIRRDQMEREQIGSEQLPSPLDFLIQHVHEGTDVDAFACNKGNTFTQPFILAVGPRLFPTQYYVIIDHMAVEAGITAVNAFDISFKAHCIFNVEYSTWTQKFWQFIGLHVYGIQMSTTAIVRSLGSAINNTSVLS